MDLLAVVALICSVPLLLLLFAKWRYSYWERKGVAQLNPEFFYGDLRELIAGEISLGEAFKNLYSAFKNQDVRFGGIYWSFKPIFIPLDPQLIKDIMQDNFSHFQDRGFITRKSDILTQNLFRMEGEAWKQLRSKLSPIFTSSRMKMMFETLCEKASKLEAIIEQERTAGHAINVSDIAGRFTTDVIGSCAFGIECDSLKNPDCDFRVYGKKVSEPNALIQIVENTVPKNILCFIGFKCFPGLEEFYRDIVLKTIAHREKTELYRKDFMHLLIQLRNRGVLTDDGKLTKSENQTGILTDEEIIAQCFVFFVGGFDSSATTTAFALYELARNPDIQQKMRMEINEVSNKYGGKLTYEGTKEMVYTEKVILETLRKYPTLAAIPRVCTKRYKIPGSNVILEKGTALQIPLWGIHMDPEYYPNPEVFDPERFSVEEKVKRPKFTHFPFGEGPRICIGARFGMLQTKVGLAVLIKDNKFSYQEGTSMKLSFKPNTMFLHPNEDICLNIEKA